MKSEGVSVTHTEGLTVTVVEEQNDPATVYEVRGYYGGNSTRALYQTWRAASEKGFRRSVAWIAAEHGGGSLPDFELVDSGVEGLTLLVPAVDVGAAVSVEISAMHVYDNGPDGNDEDG